MARITYSTMTSTKLALPAYAMGDDHTPYEAAQAVGSAICRRNRGDRHFTACVNDRMDIYQTIVANRYGAVMGQVQFRLGA